MGGEPLLYPGTRDSVPPTLGNSGQSPPSRLPAHRYFLKESPMCCFICCRPW